MSHQPVSRTCNCGLPGWMPGIEHVPIRWAQPSWITQRAGRMQPIAVVDHIMQGYLRTMVDWASNGQSKVIVHFGIDRNGRIVQFHPVNSPGRHVSAINSPASKLVRARGQDAGTTGANGYTIGIEHEGCSVDPRPAYTVPQEVIYSSSNRWPEAMVAASVRVKEWCFENVPSLGEPSRDTIIGHYEIDARNRPDDPVAKRYRDEGRSDIWPVERMMRLRINRTDRPVDDQSSEQGGGGEHVRPVTQETVMSNAYIVQRGDGLVAIAQRFGTTVDTLARRNGIVDRNRIEVGQVLRLTDDAPIPRATGTIPRPDAPPQPDTPPPERDEAAITAAHNEGYARALRDAAKLVARRGSQPVVALHHQIAEELERKANEPPPPR